MMKLLRISIAAALAILSLTAKAETHYIPHISVGVQGGGTASQVTFAPAVLQGWQPGATLGVSAAYAEERLVGLRAEINYKQVGWSEKFKEAPLNYHRSLHYISIPVMTHINFGSPRAQCFFNLGPEFAFLIGQNTKANFDYTYPTQDDRWPTDEKRMTQQFTMEVKNKFDYGICAGAGFEYWVKPRNSAFVEIRYYFGLGNIFPSSKADTFSASRNMNLSLTFGYNFRLK